MKFSQTFMEPGLNSIPTTDVIKRFVFLKRKRVHEPNLKFSEFQQKSLSMLSAETSLKGDFVFGSRFNFLNF